MLLGALSSGDVPSENNTCSDEVLHLDARGSHGTPLVALLMI